jgi:hypothetical protein
MNRYQAVKQLTQLGFEFPKEGGGNWGRQAPEFYDVGKHHFRPRFRDVFFAPAVGGWYVTSHIHGIWRNYRCRRECETTIANIFGGGLTLEIAIREFVKNFTSKTQNITKWN